jgi:IS5 family transposase
MGQQLSFTDIEYGKRRRITKREEFLNKMDAILPWKEWVELVRPYYPSGKRGRPPMEIETMLRMTLLQTWFNLSDEAVEDAIFDSYAMKSFMRICFESGEQVPDATTLCKFRKLLSQHNLQKAIFEQVQSVLAKEGKQVCGGTIVDATIISAPESTRNAEGKRDPEMHSVRKGTKWYFGMRVHIGVDPMHGFVHSLTVTAANAAEVKQTPELVRPDDDVVYGDAGYCKTDRHMKDGKKRRYEINRQRGTFFRHYGEGLSWQEERKLEQRKASVRCKVEYVFHVVKDIFGWRKARYRGIQKNKDYAYLAFASANLYMLTQYV